MAKGTTIRQMRSIAVLVVRTKVQCLAWYCSSSVTLSGVKEEGVGNDETVVAIDHVIVNGRLTLITR